MLHFFETLFLRRRSWRNMPMDELSELYISMMLRNLALSIAGVFLPIFLYVNNYSIQDIFGFYFVYFVVRAFSDIGSGHIIAKIGPKHAIMVSTGATIISSLFVLTLPEYSWPLWIPSALWAFSTSLFYVAYYVDFSKVKHADSEGSELGKITIFEKVGGVIGPLVGGLIAYAIGDQWIFVFAIVIHLISLVPLFFTAEPVKTNQHIDYNGLPISEIWRDYLAYMCVLANRNINVVMWPLFLVLFVFDTNPYLQMGSIASIGILVSVASAYVFGKVVDSKKGGVLLNASSIATAAVNLFRPITSSYGIALLVSTTADSLTNGIQIPLHKSIYDRADSLPGMRIAYLSSLEFFGSSIKSFIWGVMTFLVATNDARMVLTLGFVLSSIMVSLALIQKFPALQER